MPWNRSSNEKSGKANSCSLQKRPGDRFPIRGAIAGAIVVLGAALAAWWLWPEDETRQDATPTKKGLIKEVTPAPAPRVKDEPPSEDGKRFSQAIKKRREVLDKMSAADRHDYFVSTLAEKKLDLTPTTNHPFKTSMENEMMRLFTTPLGRRPLPVMPLHIRDEAHFEEILMAANPQIEGDGDKVIEMKEVVAAAKQELREYIKEGGDYDSFMNYYHSKLMDAYNERAELTKQVIQIARDDPDIASEFYEECNERLRKKGILPIEMSEWRKKKLNLK